MNRVRLALVDDHTSVRDLLGGYLRAWPEGELLFDAGSADEYEQLCAVHGAPDIALVDLQMPERTGWDLLQWANSHQADIRTIAISVDAGGPSGWRAVKYGAKALLSKGDGIASWVAAIVDVRDNGDHLNRWMRDALLYQPASDSPEALRERIIASLSECELRFLKAWVSEEEPTMRQLAARWKVSESTVETWRDRVGDKLGARKKTGMLMAALRFHLLDLKGPASVRITALSARTTA